MWMEVTSDIHENDDRISIANRSDDVLNEAHVDHSVSIVIIAASLHDDRSLSYLCPIEKYPGRRVHSLTEGDRRDPRSDERGERTRR